MLIAGMPACDSAPEPCTLLGYEEEHPFKVCTVDYQLYHDLSFPNEPYATDFGLALEETKQFEACVGSYRLYDRSTLRWLLAVERDGIDISDAAYDACEAAVSNGL
jgi:hypothetical protein